MTEDVSFIRGNDRIRQLAQRPDLADGVAEQRIRLSLRAGHCRKSSTLDTLVLGISDGRCSCGPDN